MTAVSPPTQENPADERRIYCILAGKIFDSLERKLVENQVIVIDKALGVILDVLDLGEFRRRSEYEGIEFISCTDLTLVPGFVDAHVHMFLHAYSETSWNDQVTKESLAERTIRATVHARNTLLAGFTTVRDLGTEGALDADISLRKCLSGRRPIIPGPRYYCSNRAIVTTGSYGPRSSLYPGNDGVEGIMGAEIADGVDGCIQAVRRQVGVGSDWIKIYADYRVRAQMGDVSPYISSRSISTFNRTELEAVISTAHGLGVKVAAHANTPDAIKNLLDLGIDTIEHGAEIYSPEDGDVDLIKKLGAAKGRVKWVPTLAAYYTMSKNATVNGKTMWTRARESFIKAAIDEGLENIACGGDTGVFDHGQNALELILMRRLGVPWEKVLTWATLGGWECVRGVDWDGDLGNKRIDALERNPKLCVDGDRGTPFGRIRRGWAADLVGIAGNLSGTPDDFEICLTQGVKVVVKGGEVRKLVK